MYNAIGIMHILVETLLSERPIILIVYPSSSIKSIKAMIEKEWNIPSDQQQLSFAQQQLEDECSLSDYSVRNESTLYLTIKKRGM